MSVAQAVRIRRTCGTCELNQTVKWYQFLPDVIGHVGACRIAWHWQAVAVLGLAHVRRAAAFVEVEQESSR